MDIGEAWIQLGPPALYPKWECALLLSWCVGRVLRPGRDTCIGQELNLICAFPLQDCTCRIEEDDQGRRRKMGRGNSVIQRQSLCLDPSEVRGQKAQKVPGGRARESTHTQCSCLSFSGIAELAVRQTIQGQLLLVCAHVPLLTHSCPALPSWCPEDQLCKGGWPRS